MRVDSANLSAETLRAAETITLGATMTAVREYGRAWADFVTKHPELVCHVIPAAPLRAYLASGG